MLGGAEQSGRNPEFFPTEMPTLGREEILRHRWINWKLDPCLWRTMQQIQRAELHSHSCHTTALLISFIIFFKCYQHGSFCLCGASPLRWAVLWKSFLTSTYISVQIFFTLTVYIHFRVLLFGLTPISVNMRLKDDSKNSFHTTNTGLFKEF